MRKNIKKIMIAVIAITYILMIISAIKANMKYHDKLGMTELNMSESYNDDNNGVTANIDEYKVVKPEELIDMYPYTADSINDLELDSIVLIYADVNIYDMDLYKKSTKGEWTLHWSMEADSGWRNNTTLDLYKALNPNIEAGEHKYVFPYVIYTQDVLQCKTLPTEWRYKLQINKTPLVYYLLN